MPLMQKMHNYHVVVEKEAVTGKKSRAVFNAYCPTLGLADWGSTIDAAVANITKLISFHLESLVALRHAVPDERNATTVIASVSVPISVSRKLSYA